ncbi:MAG: tryptophan synthase subunit alpha [Candidatus Eisenbacteria bacterium]
MNEGSSRLTAGIRAHAHPTGLIPFLTAGYPSLEGTLEMLREVDRAGAAAVELGIPFSDPIADGPDIQRASEWALRRRVGVDDVLELVRDFRRESPLPVVLMSYANPLLRKGAGAFAAAAAAAGVDGVLISDLPPEEDREMWNALDAARIDTVMLIAPTTGSRRAAEIAARSRGFLYCLARTGVTGSAAGESAPIPGRIAELRPLTSLPIGVGFGIASAEQARALRGIADALIVGAAFMRLVAQDPAHGVASRVGSFTRELIAAIH